MNYYLDALRNYANFNGRATRRQFWMFILINAIIGFVLGNILPLIHAKLALLSVIYTLALMVPNFAITARRLHDTNRSGWMQLIAMIPLVGIIILIVFCAQPGTPEANRFGE